MGSPLSFIGKIPSHGDFVKRFVSREFEDTWIRWLQHGLVKSQEKLGVRWLDSYLTSPVWKFMIGPKLIDAEAYAGVFIPSVDGVGRYFPFTLAKKMGEIDLVFTPESVQWFESLDRLSTKVLLESFELEAYCLELIQFNTQSDDVFNGIKNDFSFDSCPEHIALPSQVEGEMSCVLEHSILLPYVGNRALFWTAGSDHIEPCIVISKGLPDPETFHAFLDGSFERRNIPSPPIDEGQRNEHLI